LTPAGLAGGLLQPAFICPDMAEIERQNAADGRPGPTGVHLPGYSGYRTPE